MKRAFLTTVLAATLAGVGAAASAQPWVPSAQFEVSMHLAEALRAADAAAALKLLTDNAVLMPPDGRLVSGRKDIEAFLKARLAEGKLTLAIVSIGSSQTDSLGVDSGTFEYTLTASGAPARKGRGTYLSSLRHVEDAWKIERFAWGFAALEEKKAEPAAGSPKAPAPQAQEPARPPLGTEPQVKPEPPAKPDLPATPELPAKPEPPAKPDKH